ncbi:hypothetical protein [Halogeometricum limi]|uniref:Uncharacterized protein n=1 Tax=Halogeometricum limi TaxID=555875 RepID=A0A1I6HEJ7_9EURY|nr:hypothetical protein [Halogeometricum limi]SFR52925.1 hypothetical protein SAMN04488124_2149 [Halogeometricum limi]
MTRKGENADSRRAQSETQATDAQNPQGRNEPPQGQSQGQPRNQTQTAANERADGQQGNTTRSGSGPGSGLGALFASAAMRWGIGIAGFVLFLFALGQAVGFDLLGLFADAISSQTGRWLVVAVFALFLISVARRGVSKAFRA